jgi:hypothetical protein
MDNSNEIILKTIRRVEDAIARIDLDLEKDRQGIQDLTIRSKAMEAELVELRKAVNQSASRGRDILAEAAVPVIEATDKLTAQIKKKKIVVFQEKSRNWIQKFIGEIRKETENGK